LLSDAAGAFLDSVSERAFDQPLIAILRTQGFERIHFTHGQREFGKDVVGQKANEQWAWQSKAGDVNQSQWRDLQGQLDELRLTNLGHGAFDVALNRRPVLVITGRLTGNAPDLFRDYNDRNREKQEPILELWDRETLIGLVAENADALLRGSTDGQLHTALGSVDAGSATMDSIELFSRRWMSWEPSRVLSVGVVETSLLCESLAAKDRLDLSCHLALCLLRGVLSSKADIEACEVAGDLFEAYAARLIDDYGDQMVDENFVSQSDRSAWVTYPVRCSRIAEIAGLLALRLRFQDDERALEVERFLTDFLESQPGTAHIVSDNYAVGLAPAAIANRSDVDVTSGLLRASAIWLCDNYERDRIGLAGVGASPEEEVQRLLGAKLEWVEFERRTDSYAATVVLDLAAALRLEDLYADIWNDFEAVGILPRVLRLEDGPDQFDRTGLRNKIDPNVDFAEDLTRDPPIAPHHLDSAGRELCDATTWWNLLAVSSALRDRHYFCALEFAIAHQRN